MIIHCCPRASAGLPLFFIHSTLHKAAKHKQQILTSSHSNLPNVPTHLCSPALTVTSVLIITTWTIAPLCYPFVIRKIGAIDRTWFSPHWNPPKQFKMSSPKRRIETDVGDSVHCWECESKYLSFNARQLTWCTGFFSLQVMKWVLRPSVGFEEQLLTPYPGCT
jgi:hypothetical protein